MRKFRMLLAAGVLAILTACTAQKPAVLILTERGGQHGPFTDAAIAWLNDNADRLGVTFTEINGTEPITRDYLKGYAAIIQLDYPPYHWTDAAADAFIDYIGHGRGGWIGFHHASLLGEFDGFPMWQWFSDYLGGIRFDNYIAPLTDGTVVLEDLDHPVVQGLDPAFVLKDDEFYTYDRSPRLSEHVHVIAHVDEDSYTYDTDIKMGDHPVIWTNRDMAAHNVYFQFGHSPRLFESDNFRKLLDNAIAWAVEK